MKKKILIIEDDPFVRENTAELLELANYEVETAENGKFGIEKAKNFNPDVIICDIMMPELDGYGVLYLLSKDTATASIPFIFLTAKSERNDMRKGMELGADDYLTKPFEESELLNAIEIRLKKSALSKQSFENSKTGIEQFIDQAKALDELRKLSDERGLVQYKKGEVIYREGAYPREIYLIESGKVKLSKYNDDGRKLVTHLYSNGEFFGYLPLLENTIYKEDAIAFEDSTIYRISKADFLDLVYKNRMVGNKFIQMLSNNLVEMEERLLQLAYDSVRKKSADALLKMAKKFNNGSEEQLRINATREDLADLAGTATESLIRALADFKEEKLIEIDKKTKDIIILNEEKLQHIKW
jgi:CRP-like cAMP-binding protein/CheY-like chemotaxis protein